MSLIMQNEKGMIAEYIASGIRVPFGKDLGPSFYIKDLRDQKKIDMTKEGEGFVGRQDGIIYRLSYTDSGKALTIHAEIENRSEEDLAPEALGLKLGIDTYMIEYPQWNDVFFPTFLRCEKTHFWGYLESPKQKIVAVTCPDPVAAWELDYNLFGDEDTADFGHRIYTANLLLLCRGPLPKRHPEDFEKLPAGEKMTFDVTITPLEGTEIFRQTLCNDYDIPSLDMERYTLVKGETAQIRPLCKGEYVLSTVTPSGKILDGCEIPCDEYGVYTVTLKAQGKECEAKFYVRREWGWYLQQARKNAVYKPQKASTHTESWYGHFSAFLAKKHFPDPEMDAAARANFEEIMPLMYDLEAGRPIVIPNRIQNTACLVSLLVDAWETSKDDPEQGKKYLEWANNMAEDLIRRQSPDGAFRNGKGHYTAVIYIAKSMLELALGEKEIAEKTGDVLFSRRYEKHFCSAKAAVDDLMNMKETIGTEGEHTLEDGMIACSCLQLGFFALTLPEEERAPYIEAAEHMIGIHRCLEQTVIPDCRMRGATLRFWEAQYDVMIRGNMMNSPHGWTSWKNYATYYLYLLTGKETYLRETMDALGTCMQMIDEEGDLRWAFVCDPYLNVKVMKPDTARPSEDGYASASVLNTPAYRSRYERTVFGETYVSMVSDWYRACPEGRMMGGYPTCPLYLEKETIWVDNQGGCCDNDVHEHFKCLEETVLGKAFVLVRKDGSLLTYNCKAEWDDIILKVEPLEGCDILHVNTPGSITVRWRDEDYVMDSGMKFIGGR